MRDCLFLILLTVASVSLYVGHLGFYSDDWGFLASMRLARDHSIGGLINAIYAPQLLEKRPVQAILLAGLYWAFGISPLGYHIVNCVDLICIALLSYAVLRELHFQRLLCVAIPTIYILLPNYSTDRFWLAAFQANLSVALYLASLFAMLRSMRTGDVQRFLWVALSIITLLLSCLAYEVAMPLFFANLGLAWWLQRKRFGLAIRGKSMYLPLIAYIATLLGATLYKVLNMNRLRPIPFTQRLQNTVSISLRENYLAYGVRSPQVAWKIGEHYFSSTTVALAAAMGALLFLYLYRLSSATNNEMPSRTSSITCICTGIACFVLSCAPFMAWGLIPTSTGMGNRVFNAASVGIALTLVGGIGYVGTFIASLSHRRILFCGSVTLVSIYGFLVINTLAPFWVDAYAKEQRVLVLLHKDLPRIQPNYTVILDGICPYVGPAIVFDTGWDLQGALHIMYNDPSLGADVVTPSIQIGRTGISTSMDGGSYFYSYGHVAVFRFDQRRVYYLANAGSASHYFRTVAKDRSNGCPGGDNERGLPVF